MDGLGNQHNEGVISNSDTYSIISNGSGPGTAPSTDNNDAGPAERTRPQNLIQYTSPQGMSFSYKSNDSFLWLIFLESEV